MSQARPDVSVIMANYNGAPYLGDAVRSVLDQSLSSLELIIVDDASSDASLEAIEAAAAGDRRVRVCVQPVNVGPGAARNIALDQARGRWIAVFDSDDLMEPDRLRRLVTRADQDGAQIVADNLLVFSERGDRPAAPLLDDSRFTAPVWVDLADFIASSRMYARKPGPGYLKPLIAAGLLAQSGARYDERLRIGEDYDFMVKLLATGARLRFEPTCLYRYRKHDASISHLLRPDHIAAMLQADDAFAARTRTLTPAAQAALRRRRRSLVNALAYDRIIVQLKAGHVARALADALARPSVWPLLTLPLQARAGRAWRGVNTRLRPSRRAPRPAFP
ncbi:MAG: glycosyltransferase [Caulobacter sp.]|nr:glycosyltransferase [Caulobacter sp.]